MRALLLPLTVITAFFIMLFIYTKLAGPIPFSVNSITTTKTDIFSVTGDGEVAVSPDMAVVNLGVTTSSSTAKLVQEQLNSVINKVSSAVKRLGISEKDIQPTNFSINPNYDFREGSQKITGYSGSTNLTIKVRELDKINSVIDTGAQNGANQIGGISFEVSDKIKAEDEARKKAVEEAKRKAQNAAKTAGF